MEEIIGQIKGQHLTKIRPIGSMYHNNCIAITDDKDNLYLMDVNEIFKFHTDFNSMVFNIIQKKVRRYLKVCEEC